MWESRRDSQRLWGRWKAGFLAFHAFHNLSFPWPALGTRFTKSQFAAKGRFGDRDHLSEKRLIVHVEPSLCRDGESETHNCQKLIAAGASFWQY